MEILVKFFIEIDGECPDVNKYMLEGLEPPGAIMSEDYDPDNDWAILINGYQIVDKGI